MTELKVNALKAEIFDILVRQDQVRMQNQQLEQLKQEKLKELQDLLQQVQDEHKQVVETETEEDKVD